MHEVTLPAYFVSQRRLKYLSAHISFQSTRSLTSHPSAPHFVSLLSASLPIFQILILPTSCPISSAFLFPAPHTTHFLLSFFILKKRGQHAGCSQMCLTCGYKRRDAELETSPPDSGGGCWERGWSWQSCRRLAVPGLHPDP